MQTRKMSAVETITNYVVGYFLAWLVMHYCFRVESKQSHGMVMTFTVVSVIRSYAIRRLFNWIHVRANMNRTMIHPLDKRP